MAWHLCNAFYACNDVNVIQHYHRGERNPEFKVFDYESTQNLNLLKKADFYILAVSDSAIAALSDELPVLNGIVLHTSGSVSIDALHTKNRNGVFYPLQTLSAGAGVDFSEIPVCIEANSPEDLFFINELALKITNFTRQINSAQRKTLHLAAVFANNFVNHLYNIAFDICEEEKLEADLLNALIKETAKKITIISPFKAQTGPAKRGDKETIEKHLEMLSGNQEMIYKVLSESILEKYGRKKL